MGKKCGIWVGTRFLALFCLPPSFTLVSCSVYFFEPEEETSVSFKRTTRRYIPEDSTLHYFFCALNNTATKLLVPQILGIF
jgi:hypothetical protein